jgi:hypothetical protein
MNEIESVIESLKDKVAKLLMCYSHLPHGWSTFRIPAHHLKHFLKLRDESPDLSENQSFFGSLLDGFHLHSRVSSEKDIEINHLSVCTDPSSCSCPNSTALIHPESEGELKVPHLPVDPQEMSFMDTILDTLHLKPPDAPTAIEEEVMTFHHLADQVQRNLRALQKIVLCKYHQKRVNRKFYG